MTRRAWTGLGMLGESRPGPAVHLGASVAPGEDAASLPAAGTPRGWGGCSEAQRRAVPPPLSLGTCPWVRYLYIEETWVTLPRLWRKVPSVTGLALVTAETRSVSRALLAAMCLGAWDQKQTVSRGGGWGQQRDSTLLLLCCCRASGCGRWTGPEPAVCLASLSPALLGHGGELMRDPESHWLLGLSPASSLPHMRGLQRPCWQGPLSGGALGTMTLPSPLLVNGTALPAPRAPSLDPRGTAARPALPCPAARLVFRKPHGRETRVSLPGPLLPTFLSRGTPCGPPAPCTVVPGSPAFARVKPLVGLPPGPSAALPGLWPPEISALGEAPPLPLLVSLAFAPWLLGQTLFSLP